MESSASRIQWWTKARGFAQRVGSWITRRPRLVCPDCALDLRRARLYRELRVCDRCGHHFPLDARKRIETLVDGHSFVELERNLATRVPAGAYAKRVRAAERETRLREAVVTGMAKIQGVEVALAVLDFRFLGGSMGAVAGEKIARAFEIAFERRLPFLAITTSGGARIQEGMLALLQMAKTAAAAQRYHQIGKPFVTVLAHPTTGGVYASFANLADVIIAEPRALIGFAGPRVVEVLTRQKLPSDSHRAEFLLEHGMVDAIIPRPQLRGAIGELLGTLAATPLPRLSEPLASLPPPDEVDGISPWQSVILARHPDRPTTLDYIGRIFGHLTELHGDRLYGDDTAMIAGIASLDGQAVVVVGQERGHGAESERRRRGSAGPEGYRKAQRIMRLAAKWNLPVVTFVDTPGADAGYESEKRGIAPALARTIATMLDLRVPTVALVIGEGGSGGALALAVADCVLMLEHSVYSVISPEGASAILYGDASHAEELSPELHLTARDLKRFGIIDEMISEPKGGAHAAPDEMARRVRAHLLRALRELGEKTPEELLEARYHKYRAIGEISLGRGSHHVAQQIN